MAPILALILAAVSLRYAAAEETTLIVPFVDPQAISAKVIGVDAAQGRTTYELAQGAYTGTWTDPQGSFPGTATLVEGADYASFTYAVNDPEGSFTIGGVCSLAGGTEVCQGTNADPDDGAVAFTTTDSAVPFGLEIVTGAAATPTSGGAASASASAGSGSGASGGAAGASAGSGSGATTPSATGSAPASSQTGAARRLLATPALGVLSALVFAATFLA